MATKKLQIVTPIVTSVNGETGDVTINSVEYTQQTLTDAQKLQARENIGAMDKYNGMTPVECSYDFFGKKKTTTIYVGEGELIPPSEDASTEIKNAWKVLVSLSMLTGASHASPKSAQNFMKGVALLAENSVFGTDFLLTNGNVCVLYANPFGKEAYVRILVSNAATKLITISGQTSKGHYEQMSYSISTDTFSEYASFSKPLNIDADASSAEKLTLPQVEMAAAPTTDMQIATKRYVDAATVTPLIGSTDDITVAQVKEAVCAGRPVVISYTDSEYGALTFTGFAYSAVQDVVCANMIAYYAGDGVVQYILAELVGIVDHSWGINKTNLAESKDVSTITLKTWTSSDIT